VVRKVTFLPVPCSGAWGEVERTGEDTYEATCKECGARWDVYWQYHCGPDAWQGLYLSAPTRNDADRPPEPHVRSLEGLRFPGHVGDEQGLVAWWLAHQEVAELLGEDIGVRIIQEGL